MPDPNIRTGLVSGGHVSGGYDDSLLEEGLHPTRYDLDRASTEHPIVLCMCQATCER